MRLNDSPKATQLVSGSVRIKVQTADSRVMPCTDSQRESLLARNLREDIFSPKRWGIPELTRELRAAGNALTRQNRCSGRDNFARHFKSVVPILRLS